MPLPHFQLYLGFRHRHSLKDIDEASGQYLKIGQQTRPGWFDKQE
jgi:hypothetical protein